MTSTARVDPGRTYGNWRRPRSAGFYGQSAATTYAGIGALVLALLALMLVGILAGVIVGVGALVLLAPLLLRVNGRTAYQAGALRWQWARQKRRRAHLYRSGPLSATPGGTHRLPGVLAATTLSEGQDAFGRTFGMIHLPKTAGYTVVLRADPQGAALVEQTQVDSWVGSWGHWLGNLGQTGDIVAAAVVIDTAPDSGERLRAEVLHLVREDAPALAREILTQTAQEYPSGSALVSARIAVTFKAATAERRRDPDEMAVEVGTRLPELYASLRDAGLDATPMDGWAVAETVRLAYDPAAQQDIDEARGTGAGAQVMWHDAGPAAHEERWGSYVHDSGVSVTYAMESMVSSTVRDQVLRRLLEPHRDIARKRITLIYRPHDAGDAATIVDRDHKDAIIAASRNGLVAAAADVALEATTRARDEEARGAGVVRFSILMTTTVADADQLRRTDAVLRTLAATARLKVRPCYGYQAAAFAAALGVGVLLPEHATIPGALAN
jgi:gas vesicle protein